MYLLNAHIFLFKLQANSVVLFMPYTLTQISNQFVQFLKDFLHSLPVDIIFIKNVENVKPVIESRERFIFFFLLQPNTSSSSVTRTTSVTPQTDHRMPVKARLGIPAPNLLSLDNTVPKKTETAEKVKIIFLHLAIKEKSNYPNHNKWIWVMKYFRFTSFQEFYFFYVYTEHSLFKNKSIL